MRNIIVILSLLFLISCQSAKDNKVENKSKSDSTLAKVQIYYFHATNRCPTCISIETNTQKVLDTYFKKEVESGVIKFTVLNFDEDKNAAICEKYQASGSALHLVKISNGKEIDNDLTNDAFSYSRSEPDKFIAIVKDKITELLK